MEEVFEIIEEKARQYSQYSVEEMAAYAQKVSDAVKSADIAGGSPRKDP